MKMYKTSSWDFKIEEVEILRKTDKCVFYESRGQEVRANNDRYFDTWELAKQSIIDRERDDLERAEGQLKHAQEELIKAYKLTNPVKE